MIFLIILQSYLVSKCLLEDTDNVIFDNPNYKAFMDRQITDQRLVVEHHIRPCQNKEELGILLDYINELIEESQPEKVGEEPDEVVNSESIADWKSRVLLFVGLSGLIFVLANYYDEIISSVVSIASSITVELQDLILNRLEVLMQLDPIKISTLIDNTNIVDD